MRRSVVALAILALGTSEAQAQEAELDMPAWARAERSYAGVSAEFFRASPFELVTETSVAFEPFVQVAITRHWVVSASLPMGYSAIEQDNDPPGPVNLIVAGLEGNAFVVGSAIVGGHYSARVADAQLNLWAGLKLGIPTTLTSDDLDTRRAGGAVGALRGDAEAHRFADGAVALRPEGGLEWRNRAEWLYLRSTLAPTILLPAFDHGEVNVTLDHLSEAEARAHFGLGGGLGLRQRFWLTARTNQITQVGGFLALRDDDLYQAAIEPFLGYESPEVGFFARFGVLVSLDDRSTVIQRPRLAVPRLTLGAVW